MTEHLRTQVTHAGGIYTGILIILYNYTIKRVELYTLSSNK